MTRTKLLVLPLAVVLAGCASGDRGPYSHLDRPRLAVEGLGARNCHYVAAPEAPASLDELARPGTRGSIMLWGRDSSASDTVEVSVRYGYDGRLSWTRAISSNVHGSRVAELERVLSSSVGEYGPADWGVRIRVVGGTVEAVLPSVVCDARRGPRVGDVMPGIVTRADQMEMAQAAGRDLQLAVGLDEQGRVLGVRLVHTSGSRLLDQYGMDLARAHSYEPKLHDGIGVPTTLDVRFRVPRRRF